MRAPSIRPQAALGLTALGLLIACGGVPEKPTSQPAVRAPIAPVVGAATSVKSSAATLSDKPLDCGGKIIPPTGYYHAVAFVPEAEGGAIATSRALVKLQEKVCQGQCGRLAAEFKIWRQGVGAGQACAMAVINRKRVTEWRASQNISGLAGDIDVAAKTLIASLKTRKPKIFVARINDSGAVGGPRARWLLPQLRRAFDAAGAIPVVVREWDGDAVPRGVDAVVMATLEDRKDQGNPVVDLAVDLLHKVGRANALRSAVPISFPAAAAPAPGTRLPKMPVDKGLMVRFETGEGGVLCAGAQTRLRLKADEDLHVRVFSLYGENGALLIHPTQGGDDTVYAAKPILIGGAEGFEALPLPGTDAERVLVVAAKDRADLGALGKYSSTCRLPPSVAARLHRFEGLPTRARISADGYRIVEGGACPSLDIQKRADMQRMLAEVPECP